MIPVNRSEIISLIKRIPGVIYALVISIVFFAYIAEGFFTISNFLNVARQGSVLAIVATGMTLAIISRGIDLSVGGVLSLAGVITGLLLHRGVGLSLSIFSGVIIGSLCGAINGLLIAKAQLVPFVATFGMMNMAMGLALALCEGAALPGFSYSFRYLGDGYITSIPVPVWIAGVTFLIFYFLLRQTSFGIHVYAIGGNEEAAILTGIKVSRCKTIIYLLSGTLAGFAGVILASRMNSAHPTVGIGYEFDAIASTVVGGTALSGGRGGVAGTIIGAAIITMLKNSLNILGVTSPWQLITIGMIIVLAIIVDVTVHR